MINAVNLGQDTMHIIRDDADEIKSNSNLATL